MSANSGNRELQPGDWIAIAWPIQGGADLWFPGRILGFHPTTDNVALMYESDFSIDWNLDLSKTVRLVRYSLKLSPICHVNVLNLMIYECS